MTKASEDVFSALACPYCASDLTFTDEIAVCGACRASFPITPSGQPDFRLKKSKQVLATINLGFGEREEFDPEHHFLETNPKKELDFSGLKAPEKFTPEMMSHFPRAAGQRSLALDIGCGDTRHKAICEFAGFIYIGLDVFGSEPTILGDAHALPLKRDSVEFVLSMAVLEHLEYPYLAVEEAYRVLKPGGRFIGTVAFQEPYHDHSFFHASHLGATKLLEHAGFRVEHISPKPDWHFLKAHAYMSLFPRAPSFIGAVFYFPLFYSHRLWWWAARFLSRGKRAAKIELLMQTMGAIIFIGSKPRQATSLA